MLLMMFTLNDITHTHVQYNVNIKTIKPQSIGENKLCVKNVKIKRAVPELIPVLLGSQPSGDIDHKTLRRLPLLSDIFPALGHQRP